MKSTLRPTCHGKPWPKVTDPLSAAKREFLEAFAEINLASATLAKIRKRSVPDKQAERAALELVEEALIRKEALDVKHATTGLYANPQFEDGLITDVTFGSHRLIRDYPGSTGEVSSFVTLMDLPSRTRRR